MREGVAWQQSQAKPISLVLRFGARKIKTPVNRGESFRFQIQVFLQILTLTLSRDKGRFSEF
jgi:hypothetical protein